MGTIKIMLAMSLNFPFPSSIMCRKIDSDSVSRQLQKISHSIGTKIDVVLFEQQYSIDLSES